MPYGSGQVIRQAMMYAKPWQRYVIAGTMMAGGAGAGSGRPRGRRVPHRRRRAAPMADAPVPLAITPPNSAFRGYRGSRQK
jgi:hypothetical protein